MRSLKQNKFQKTSFTRSAIFTLIEAFIPGLLVWILFGKDIVIFHQMISLQVQIIISVVLFIWCIASTYIFYLLNYTNYDQFGFSVPVCIVIIIIFITSFYNLNFWIRLVICLVSIFASTVIVNLIIYLPSNIFSRSKK